MSDMFRTFQLKNRGAHTPVKRRHVWLYALPSGKLPAFVECAGHRYDLVKTFKHDFFAATGLYRGQAGLTVVKFGRITPIFDIPLRFVGAWLTRREMHLYTIMQHSPGIPRLIGPVGESGFMHAYVPGRPLDRKDLVDSEFFKRLSSLICDMHSRHIAYVDLNKPQNIILGDDGRPYLIDFQISLHLPPIGWRRFTLVRWLLARFQNADRYHALKHKRRLRPDLLTDDEKARVENLSFWIKLHRFITRPITLARRRTLKRLHQSESEVVVGSSAK